MNSKFVTITSRILGIAVLLSGIFGLASWGRGGGIGSGEIELLVLSFGAIWFGLRLLDKYGRTGK